MLQKRLAEGFEALGIRSGDTLLVHSSLKSLEGASPADVIEALLALLGPEGTLMFPTLSYLHSNRNNPVFDVRRTPSNVGAIPDYFRTEYPDFSAKKRKFARNYKERGWNFSAT